MDIAKMLQEKKLARISFTLCIFPPQDVSRFALLRLTKVLQATLSFYVVVMLLQAASGSQSLISKEYQAILRHWR